MVRYAGGFRILEDLRREGVEETAGIEVEDGIDEDSGWEIGAVMGVEFDRESKCGMQSELETVIGEGAETGIGEGAETGAEVVIGEEKTGDAMSGTELGITNELE